MHSPVASSNAATRTTLRSLLRQERMLFAFLPTVALFVVFGRAWLADLSNLAWEAFVFVWLFLTIVLGAKAVVRHADRLAQRLGEPYGTLLLTLSVASIEIMTIGVVMLTGANNPTLARDSMFSVVMIVLNGLIGLALLLGGWRYREQEYNLRGVVSYLSVIVSLSVFSLIMPNFTRSTDGPTFSAGQEGFLIVMCLGLYAVFVGIQTTRHRAYFVLESGAEARQAESDITDTQSILFHTGFLFGYLALVVFLAEKIAVVLDHAIEALALPTAIGGLAVAMLVLAPEALGAVQAALRNRMQRAINILLGSVLATLALTIPAVLIIGLLHDLPIVLGLNGVEGVMLGLTLAVSMVTFSGGRTNILQGAVHLTLFLAYLMLVFWN